MPTQLFPRRSPEEKGVQEFEAWNREFSGSIAIDVGGWSRMGSSRRRNEDHWTSASVGLSLRCAGAPLLLAVADGFGGEEAGERASHLATQSMVEFLEASWACHPGSGPEELLKDAFRRAHRDIFEYGNADVRCSGMSSTLTAALVLWPRAYLIHAGDCRAYRLHRGELEQLSIDHTAADLLVARGKLSREAARTSRYRLVLWNHLEGEAQILAPQRATMILEPGDGLLLTTDGLTEALGHSELAELASRPCSAHAVCHMMVEAARARDDATALFARFDG